MNFVNGADDNAPAEIESLIINRRLELTKADIASIKGGELACVIVNLADYTVGADKGGAVSMFDDFDIDFNAQKYLIETRCSGALTTPYSAIVVEFAA